ncbi:Hypothetical_protein [Hexamita inflata]|uniref:Hypothetical_protein n=1 Tax=Hexamita inflata TaxID=28002 RepID=A0AA86QET7_9EUKA|nr:Hypothetical protein HINF_LOCUS45005 [Hexamita inflata]
MTHGRLLLRQQITKLHGHVAQYFTKQTLSDVIYWQKHVWTRKKNSPHQFQYLPEPQAIPFQIYTWYMKWRTYQETINQLWISRYKRRQNLRFNQHQTQRIINSSGLRTFERNLVIKTRRQHGTTVQK